jgi:hypothetical protein
MITQVQFHPSRPQILLSGSTDGLVNIYNTTVSDEEDALHQTINHGHSIHHANFLNDTDIYALSHDEQFSTYELVTNEGEEIEEPAPVNFGDIREMLGGEYAANVVRRPDGSAVLGIGSHRYVSKAPRTIVFHTLKANNYKVAKVLILCNSRSTQHGALYLRKRLP